MVQDQMFIKSMFKFHIHFILNLIFVTDRNTEKYSCLYSVKEGPKAFFSQVLWCPIILTLQYWYATSVQLCWRQTLTMWLSTVTMYVGCNFAFIKESPAGRFCSEINVSRWNVDTATLRYLLWQSHGRQSWIHSVGFDACSNKDIFVTSIGTEGPTWAKQHRLPLKCSSHIRYCLIITFLGQGKSYFYPKFYPKSHWTITKARRYIQWSCIGINEGIAWPAKVFINDDDSQGKII